MSSFALFFTTSPCWAYRPSLATHRTLRRVSLAGIYGRERTDWLFSMEHLRTWAHTPPCAGILDSGPRGGLGLKVMAWLGGIGTGWFGGGG
ncbi:hypothetical protein B0T18DRAFT_59953 [Schizothecium vesticola]|uniref:Uncharacterized protein n=1 Tax=Schizothecium vesticola TaxID=314040 RepID=A0AA40F4Y0_9PEZI|nr:hypothetical protein B0T18DRAFT_59953 [Schizothecium vesticola]